MSNRWPRAQHRTAFLGEKDAYLGDVGQGVEAEVLQESAVGSSEREAQERPHRYVGPRMTAHSRGLQPALSHWGTSPTLHRASASPTMQRKLFTLRVRMSRVGGVEVGGERDSIETRGQTRALSATLTFIAGSEEGAVRKWRASASSAPRPSAPAHRGHYLRSLPRFLFTRNQYLSRFTSRNGPVTNAAAPPALFWNPQLTLSRNRVYRRSYKQTPLAGPRLRCTCPRSTPSPNALTHNLDTFSCDLPHFSPRGCA